MLNDINNEIFIIEINFKESGNPIPLIGYDLKGKELKLITYEEIMKNVRFIDCYYDNAVSKIYLVTGNQGCSASYNYNENKLYHKYNNPDDEDDVVSMNNYIIHKEDNIVKITTSYVDGFIRIFNFNSGELLNKKSLIEGNNRFLWDICL